MTDTANPPIEVFSRPGCHLCEELLAELAPLVRGHLAIAVRNIDDDDGWSRKYGLDIPVVVYDGDEVCRHRLDRAALARLLERS